MGSNVYIHGSSDDEQLRLSTLNKLLNKPCIGEMDIQFGDRIIDVGSGLGQMTRLMAEQSGPVGFVLGVERDMNQLKKANESSDLQTDSPHVEFRLGDAHNLPLTFNEWGSFDIAHCRFVLEHVPQPSRILEQMIRAVKKGGRVIAADDEHSILRITPESDKINRLWKVYTDSFSQLGNDPGIGKKLVSLMYGLGLRKIRNKMLFFGSSAEQDNFRDYSFNFIKVMEGAREAITGESLMNDSEFDHHIEHLENWAKRPDAAIWYSICWAEGHKI